VHDTDTTNLPRISTGLLGFWFGPAGVLEATLSIRLLIFLRSHGGSQTGKLDCEDSKTPLQLDETKTNEVRYTYRITWQVSFVWSLACTK
jgi:hypothetical protein